MAKKFETIVSISYATASFSASQKGEPSLHIAAVISWFFFSSIYDSAAAFQPKAATTFCLSILSEIKVMILLSQTRFSLLKFRDAVRLNARNKSNNVANGARQIMDQGTYTKIITTFLKKLIKRRRKARVNIKSKDLRLTTSSVNLVMITSKGFC